MSQVKYCPKCRGQLIPNAKFCPTCGSTVSVLQVQATPAEPKALSRWVWVGVIAMIILAFLAGTAIVPERVVTTTRTSVLTSYITRVVTSGPTAVTTGVQRIKIGQTFSFLTSDKVPVEITFTSLRYADKAGFSTADKGYKLAVLDVTVKNVGTKETRPFSSFDKWIVIVDKGYTYDAKASVYLPDSVRPEEVKTGYTYFEILETTTPIEIRHTSMFGSTIYFVLEL
jgi:hypothetical protein